MFETFLVGVHSFGLNWFGAAWPVVWTLIKIFAVVLPLLGCVAYLTLAERKVIAWMHVRIGPNRTGPLGLLQPIADALKLLFKEVIVPFKANKVLYVLAPMMTMMPALACWAVVPFQKGWVLSDANVGVLLLLAITSMEVYGIVLAGWASNSKYAFLGAMRASAQIISYELAMGFAVVCVLMVAGTLNLTGIVEAQMQGRMAAMGLNFLSWNWLPLLPMFVVFIISGVAETNRHPFDVVEGESEIVAGHMIEYSGMGFAIFFLAEYANMILVSVMTAVLFLGGWDAPISALSFVPGFLWLLMKTCFVLFLFLWIRATFPRFRYDQIMRLGWKVFVPLCLFWIVVMAIWIQSPYNIF
jgi:NADH-quinone oxidoreductase subunit H